MYYPYLLKYTDIEILLNSQLLAFPKELSLHIFWKNTKIVQKFYRNLDYRSVPHSKKKFICGIWTHPQYGSQINGIKVILLRMRTQWYHILKLISVLGSSNIVLPLISTVERRKVLEQDSSEIMQFGRCTFNSVCSVTIIFLPLCIT